MIAPARAFLATRRLLVCLAAVLFACLAAAGVASAQTPATWWRLNALAAPTLIPVHGEAQIIITASNLGDSDVNASAEPVTLTDELPAGVRPVGTSDPGGCSIVSQTVTCTFRETVPPFQTLDNGRALDIVAQSENPREPLLNMLAVHGGDTPPPAALQQPLRLQRSEGEATPFGVQAFQLQPEGEDGSPAAQAGSHPFQLTTVLDFNARLEPCETEALICREGRPGGTGAWPSAAALPRNVHVTLPPGLVGDPGRFPRCATRLFHILEGSVNHCPDDAALGVVSVTVFDPGVYGLLHKTVPLFNLEPSPGEPARFGFVVENVPVELRTAVAAGGDYAVQVSVEDISQAVSVLSSEVTIWGTPGAAVHDSARGYGCLQAVQEQDDLPCEPSTEPSPRPLLTLPTSCQPPTPATEASVSASSWPAGPTVPEQSISDIAPSTAFPTPTGCESLAFGPSLTVEPETGSASTPAGVNVGVGMPQPGLTDPDGDAEAALKQTTVTLPPGLELNPAAATALQACSASEFHLLDTFGDPFGMEGVPEEAQTGNETTPSGPANCPTASKVGTVTISTPLLPHELTGSVYLAAQNTSPFKSPLAVYLLAEDAAEGVRVKLAGTVEPNPATGQLTSVFKNTPELPFTALHLHFFGGQRASLTTPPACGPATTTSEFVPWSGQPATHPESTFQITAGAGGTPCPLSPLSFAPSFTAGPTSPAAGAFSPLVVDIGKPDRDQPLTGVSVTLPPGFAAVLASVSPCPEPPAGQEWSCGEDSHIGEVREYAGLGTEPVVLTGQAYLTSGYDGAPFGLLVRTLAAAGPFDLGWVNVRNRIDVNPSTAQVTVTSDPGPRGEAIPTILDGVPVQLKALEVAVNRPSFNFNPTNCEPLTTTASLSGSEGASASLSAPFKAEGCSGLPFHPTLEASTAGQASKAGGASLNVKVTSQGLGVANIQKVFLTIPKILPSRLQPTLQHACTEAVFNANPAGCDEDSMIGYATVHTPILKSPLTGPAYVVSHGNAAFPDVEFVLQGEGITLIVDGKTDIKHGVTYSRFESTPDAPFTTFETVLPAGPHSILAVNTEEAPNYNLCTHKITIPTTITAQDGAVIEQTTKVAVTGCAAVKSYKATRAQLLAKALKACKQKYKKNNQRRKRAACEKAARKKYATKATKKKSPEKTAKSRRRP